MPDQRFAGQVGLGDLLLAGEPVSGGQYRYPRLGVQRGDAQAGLVDGQPHIAMGFTESDHYLYVYANYYTEPGEPDRAIGIRRRGRKPMAAFLHASLDEEQQLRGEFSRIHVCRRFALPL